MRYLPESFLPSTLDSSIFNLILKQPTVQPTFKPKHAITPKVWGPNLWTILHSTAEQFDPSYMIEPRDSVVELVTEVIPTIIPCKQCREHYEEMTLQEKPHLLFYSVPYNKLQSSLRLYLFNIHNKVNIRKGKPLFKESDIIVYSNVDIPYEISNYRRLMQSAVDENKMDVASLNRFKALVTALT
jgi:hypothetical protein